jgi:hypothetical protein
MPPFEAIPPNTKREKVSEKSTLFGPQDEKVQKTIFAAFKGRESKQVAPKGPNHIDIPVFTEMENKAKARTDNSIQMHVAELLISGLFYKHFMIIIG